MKTVNKKNNVVIALITVTLFILSWGVVQYQQMSNLMYRISYPDEKWNSYTFKDSFFNRSATEFSEYLNRLRFLPADDDLMNSDYNNHIRITVEDGSEYLINNYVVLEHSNQYIMIDIQDTYPDKYAVVEGTQYDYLHQKLLEGRERLGIIGPMDQK